MDARPTDRKGRRDGGSGGGSEAEVEGNIEVKRAATGGRRFGKKQILSRISAELGARRVDPSQPRKSRSQLGYAAEE